MLNRLIDYIAHKFNQEFLEKIEDLKLMNERDYAYFRRGSCKGCLFYAKNEKLLTEGKGYCIFNPTVQEVSLKYKCGRIVKR